MKQFAIITTDPKEPVAEKTGHDRMPLIVEHKDYQCWLEPAGAERPPFDLLPRSTPTG
jgi:putative SOS response-associated peptidase YedK